MAQETIGHTERVCSICGGDLDYMGQQEVDDGGLSYTVACRKCGANGKEWYNVEFSEVRMISGSA